MPIIDVGMFFSYAVPIINTVLMFTSVAENQDTTKTMLTTAIVLVCVCTCCLPCTCTYVPGSSCCICWSADCIPTPQMVVLTVQWVLLHLVVYWWGKLDESLLAGGLGPTSDDGAMCCHAVIRAQRHAVDWRS